MGERIRCMHVNAERLQLGQNPYHARVTNVRYVFLERDTQYTHGLARSMAEQVLYAFARDPCTHVIVDAAARQDDFRMVAGAFRAIGQIIWIHAYAVPSDQTRSEGQEIPFGSCCIKDVGGVYIEQAKDQRKLVDERHVEVALGVFDNFCRFGDHDRRRPMYSRRDNRAIGAGDDFKRLVVVRGYDLDDIFEAMPEVARIDPLGAIADVEVDPVLQT